MSSSLPPTGYEGLYDEPEVDPASAEKSAEDAAEDDSTDPGVEAPVPEALRKAPPPPEYADFYDAPDADAD